MAIQAYSTIDELGRALRAREVSSVELTRFYLERLEKHGERLGAVVTITRMRALREAEAADREFARGDVGDRPLLGIPYGVKDLLATKDIPTTWGAEPYRNQVFDFDATVVEKLTRAGGVLVAKLAMVELAGGFGYNNADASFTGPGRTPWNPDFWSGGSSSGPGAAVGAALVPYAIGSETSGSILTPAAFSGVTGLRPTYGAVSRYGAMALCWTLDKIGPMARTAADCNTIFGAIRGDDPNDPTTSNVYRSGQATWVSSAVMGREPNRRKVRIGLVKGSWDGVQPAVRDNFLKSVDVLRSHGHTITEVDYPDLPYGPTVATIVDAEGASAFEDILVDGRAKQLRVAADRIGGFESAATLAIDYLRAQRVRAKIRQALLKLFESVDLVVSPTRATVAYPIGPNFNEVYRDIRGGPAVIGSMNLLGAPAVALPNGFGENGLPTSIQFNAAPSNEAMLLNVAIHYQNATDHHVKRPEGFA
ncbi:MAG TPA: amidase [Thermoanaerobaculia bacterium]|nr:amidase [Thermoanaerobaculia bacterium]